MTDAADSNIDSELDRHVPLDRMGIQIAKRLTQAKTEIPEYSVEMRVDMSAAVEARVTLKATHAEPVPSINDMIVKASALALRDHPRLNSSFDDGAILFHRSVNVGIAVGVGDVLVVPVIKSADSASLSEISASTRELADKVRRKTIAFADLSDGTFTVSNLGMFGVTRFTAIINQPQVAILSIGQVHLRPVVDDMGTLSVRHVANLTLTCDHRVVYGVHAAQFLSALQDRLKNPSAL
jgi:pyruvate dehydrogenase E2 component (dihydrolipoamide acetyltransferase)